MIKETVLSRSLRLMFAGGMALGMQFAYAQDVQKVEITGSSIKRIAAESSLPVQSFSQKDIQKTGVTSVTDFIQQLPAMQGFTTSADSVGGGGGGITTASIHDLGGEYTLVLLNGRRVAPATSGGSIDLNSIPLSAIERVEVLTDGASALYGADAIAGVINFILKKGAAPFEVTLKTTQPHEKGGSGYNFTLSKGFGDMNKDGFNVFLSYGHDENKQLKAADRDFAKTGIIRFNDPKTGKELEFFNGSSRSVPPNITVRYKDAAGANKAVNLNPYKLINNKCAPAHADPFGDGQCWFDYTSSVEIFPEQKRDAFFASGSVKLGDSGFKLFTDLSYTDAHIYARIAPYPAEFSMAKNHALFAKYITPYLTAEQNAGFTSSNVKYRLYDMGNRAYDYATTAKHQVYGIDGSFGGFDLNAAITLSDNKQDTNYIGGFPLADKFLAALDAGKVDPFPYIVGTMPADQLAALNATQYKGKYSTQDVKMRGFDMRASVELFKLGGGTAVLAAGSDYRTTKFKTTYQPVAKDALILFEDPSIDNGYKRTTKGGFAELLLPLTKQLEITSSARYDVIGAVHDTLSSRTFGESESAFTYKLSGRFELNKKALFRASYGTGFKAASMRQIAQPLEDFGVTGGTYNCPLASNHPLITGGGICERGQFEAFQGGNPDLKPEKSKQWSFGAVFEPADFMSASLDFWHVEVRNAVSEVSEAQIFADPAKFNNLFTTKFKASNGLKMVAIKLLPINIGAMENEGIDYDLKFRNKIFDGRLTTQFAGTHLLKSRYTKPGTSNEWTTSLDQFGINDAVSFRNIFRLSTTFEKGAWAHSATLNYRNGYKDKEHTEDNCAVTTVSTGDCAYVRLDVGDYATFDWQTKYSPMKGLDLTFGILNLFDKKPPLSLRNTGSHQLGYDPRYASALGRTFYVSGSYKF